jgi:hypothetical protein
MLQHHLSTVMSPGEDGARFKEALDLRRPAGHAVADDRLEEETDHG